MAKALFATGLDALAFASPLCVRLMADVPVGLFAPWAAFAPRFEAGPAQPEAITFLAPLAWSFAEDFLTGRESFCAMTVNDHAPLTSLRR